MTEIQVLILNAILYSATTIFCAMKYGINSIGFYLLFVYSISSLGSISFYSDPLFEISVHKGHIVENSVWYLYAVLLLFFLPIIKFDNTNIKAVILLSEKKYFFVFYPLLIIALLNVFIILPDVKNGIFGNIADTRSDIGYIAKDRGIIINVFLRITSGLQDISLLLSFYGVLFVRKKRGLIILFFILSIILPILFGLAVAGRGPILLMLLNFLFLYILLFRFINNKLRARINRGLMVFGALFGVLFLIISFSRFDNIETYTVGFFFKKYLGENFVNFHGLLFDQEKGLAYGNSSFPFFRHLLGFEYPTSLEKARSMIEMSTGLNPIIFYTFVGNLYIDFGPYITLIISIIVCLLGLKFIKSTKIISFHKFFLLFMMANVYLGGVFWFVQGSDSGNLYLVYSFAFYYYFKTIRKKVIKKTQQ